jgi:hypothetical protein
MDLLAATYRHAPGLALRRLGAEAVAITTHDSQVHELNETAAAIVLACERPATGHDVLSALESRFEVAPDAAAPDVSDFLARLVDAGLLVRGA